VSFQSKQIVVSGTPLKAITGILTGISLPGYPDFAIIADDVNSLRDIFERILDQQHAFHPTQTQKVAMLDAEKLGEAVEVGL